MAVMDDILENKKKEVQEFKEVHGDHVFTGGKPPASFYKAVKKDKTLSVIAEVKRKSPSQGEMAMEEDPADIAKLYAEVGADAISVLTDEKFFGGGFDFLREIADTVTVPLLCKDFIIDPIQIDMAKLNGASAVLLITEILDDKQLLALYEYSAKLGLDALVEAHKIDNVKRAAELDAKIIGINNRNLFTFEEDLKHSLVCREFLPDAAAKISLSSCKTREDAIFIAKAGYDGILMGGVLMKAFNKRAALNSFLGVGK